MRPGDDRLSVPDGTGQPEPGGPTDPGMGPADSQQRSSGGREPRMSSPIKLRRIMRELKAPASFLRQYPGLAAKVARALEKAGGPHGTSTRE